MKFLIFTGAIIFVWISVFLFYACGFDTDKPPRVTIEQADNLYTLYQGEQPYFVKGAVGVDFMEKLPDHGANSVRIWTDHAENLRQAYRLGLTALVSLPVKAECRGMDYDDEEMVNAQFDEIMGLVDSIKDKPANF